MKKLISALLLFLTSGFFSCALCAEVTQKTRIAVLYFENNSRRAELAPLAKGLCDMMISAMAESAQIAVVERTRLEEVLKEINLSNSKSFDQGTAAKIGKLLGAEYLVFGSFLELGTKFRIDARMVHVETGRICATAGVAGKADDFDEIERKVVDKLLLKLPSKGADAANKQSGGKAKVSVKTATKYGTALDKIDSGDKKNARKILSEVVAENPDFTLAANTLREISAD